MTECENCRNNMYTCTKCKKSLCSKDCYKENNEEEQYRYVNGKKVCRDCIEKYNLKEDD